LGRLRKARLVTIGRRDREEAGQNAQQRDQREHGKRARVRARGEVGDRDEAARGFVPLAADGNSHGSPTRLNDLPDNRELAGAGKGRRSARADRTGRRPQPGTMAACLHGYCNRTTTLSVAPSPSITVRRMKPGPSGAKNSVRRPGPTSGSGMPLTSTVRGPEPPVTLSAIGSGRPSSPLASSTRAPLGGNMMRSGGPSPARPSGRNRCSGGGNLVVAAISVPFGAAGKLAGSLPVPAQASDRIGAAAARP